MPANKYALLRYRIIDRSIRNPRKPYPSKEDLRVACEEALYGSNGEHISTSTIDKDLWAMRNEGELGFYAPIKFSKEYKGYFYEDPEYTISEVPLNDDDLDAIRLAAETLFQFKEIPLFAQFDAAIEKIMDRMKISSADKQEVAHEIIQFERAEDYKGSEFLEPLFRACSANQVVKFDYQKFNSEEKSNYMLEPYLLKEYRSRWYIIGREEKRGVVRTFSLDRIVNLQLQEKFFSAKHGFDTKQFFEHSVGITVTDEKPEKVGLKFYERLAPYIMSQPLHPSQVVLKADNGQLEMEIHVLITVELVSTILGFGDQAEVLYPQHLRANVNNALSHTLNRYR